MPAFEQQESANLARRLLIVNADDFGRNAAINEGIRHAVEHGIVTSASLMVRWPAAIAAAVYARRNRRLSVGLHVDLGEWEYRDGEWRAVYEVVSLDDRGAVTREVTRQVESFRDLVGRNPTHLDSHQHVHRQEPVRSVLREFARQLDVPLRHENDRIRHCGDFYGQSNDGKSIPDAITPKALTRIVRLLDVGITELGCHPGNGTDGCSSYDAERKLEMAVLCDPQLRDVLEVEQIELIGFEGFTNWHAIDAVTTSVS